MTIKSYYRLPAICQAVRSPTACFSIGRGTHTTAGRGDRHRKTNSDKYVLPGGIDDSINDTDHVTVAVQQRAARITRIDGRVDLDQALDGLIAAIGGLE